VTKVDVHTPAGLDTFVDHLDGASIVLADMGAGAGQVASDWFDSMYEDVAATGVRFHRQFSNEAQQKMLGYVQQLELRISNLPREIEAGLDPQQIAKILGESLRQHFVLSGVTEIVTALRAAAGGMVGAQQKLTRALMS
jgi:hypothetical protein